MVVDILKRLNLKSEISAFTNMCIQHVRFSHLIANSGAMISLFEDGKEKNLGEYILDRHYVESLTESIIERLGKIVYDACVISPEKGEVFYRKLDHHRDLARNLMHRPEESQESDSSLEYQMLANVLNWFNEEQPMNEDSVTVFMLDLLSAAAFGIKVDDSLRRSIQAAVPIVKGVRPKIHCIEIWKDGFNPSTNPKTIDVIHCAPLELLMMNAIEIDSTSSGSVSSPSWLAMTSDHQLSLQTLSEDSLFRLETEFASPEKPNYIFIFSDKSFDRETFLSDGFYLGRSDSCYMAWQTDVSEKNINKYLMSLGSRLLGPSKTG